jgi:Family of unknown function (DUF6152)
MAIRSLTLAWTAGLALLATAGVASAHHSFGMFDMQKTVTIDGTIKDYQWTNPHVWIDLVVLDPATNQTVLWSIEANSTAIQTRMGWSRTSLKPGDKATIVLHPLRTGEVGGSLVSGNVNGAEIGHAMERP